MSEVEFHRELNNPLVASCIVLPEIGARYRRITGRPQFGGRRQVAVRAEDRVPGLTRSVGHISGQIVSGELRMVQNIERLHAKLQVSLSFASHRKALEDRQILVPDAGVAQVETRV